MANSQANLFEHTGSTSTPDSDQASESGKRSPLQHLQATLERNADRFRSITLHPRQDRLWVTREGDTYTLSVRRGKEQYEFTGRGVRQFASMFDVSASLLDRLAGLPRVEDCRLLNMLMFAHGDTPDAYIRFRIRDSRIASAHSSQYTHLPLEMIADALEERESEGSVRLRRYEFANGGLWIELEFPGLPSQDLSPVFDRRNAKADIWRPGCILWNQEDGSTAVTIVPAFFREWGGIALPVLRARADVRKRRHVEDSAETLLSGILSDIDACAEAPFAQAAERFRGLHEAFLPSGGVKSHLDGLRLPLPSQSFSNAVVGRVTSGRPTRYRLVTALLYEAREIEAPPRRLRIQIATGRLVWTGGGRKKK